MIDDYRERFARSGFRARRDRGQRSRFECVCQGRESGRLLLASKIGQVPSPLQIIEQSSCLPLQCSEPLHEELRPASRERCDAAAPSEKITPSSQSGDSPKSCFRTRTSARSGLRERLAIKPSAA